MGYENDLQTLGLLSGGADGFIKGWQDADDRKMKKMELDARLKSDESKKQIETEERNYKRTQDQLKQTQDHEAQALRKRKELIDLRTKGYMVNDGDDVDTLSLSSLKRDPEWVAEQVKIAGAKAEAGAAVDPFGSKREAAKKAKSEAEYGNLPEDRKIQVKKLSEKIGDRKTIGADLDAAMAQLEDPNKSDDEKLLVGRELIKTLNSTQGQDAVGAEESKRLASLLEYKVLPRIGEPGKTFGRDLNMFTTQVRNNRARVSKSAEDMQKQADGLLGRTGLVQDGLVGAGGGGGEDKALAAKKKRLEELKAKAAGG